MRAVSSALCVTVCSYVYNRAGEEGKLPSNWGYVRPAATISAFLGASTLVCKSILPTRFTYPAIILLGTNLVLISLDNSIEDIRKRSLKTIDQVEK